MAPALLIDDDKALLESLEGLAKEAGLELRTAATWENGLALFHILSPDLVIADYNLPGSSHGLQLLARIRHYRPSVRLVLVSGVVGTAELAEVEKRGGAHRVLPKSMETVGELIKEITAAQEQQQESTDWANFARSYLDAKKVLSEDIDEIDTTIQESISDD